jgi:hypothetical protein
METVSVIPVGEERTVVLSSVIVIVRDMENVKYNFCFTQNGACVCAFPWKGKQCEHSICPSNCNGNGKCTESGCLCNVGWVGIDCKVKVCPNGCGPNGSCVEGKCVCGAGFGGLNCEKQVIYDVDNRNALINVPLMESAKMECAFVMTTFKVLTAL